MATTYTTSKNNDEFDFYFGEDNNSTSKTKTIVTNICYRPCTYHYIIASIVLQAIGAPISWILKSFLLTMIGVQCHRNDYVNAIQVRPYDAFGNQ